MAEIRDELFYKQKNGYDTMSTQQRIDMEDYCRGYMAFLNEARTEREAVKIAIEMAEDKGFVEYVDGMKLSPGDKVYCNNRSKALMLAVIGRKSLEEGCVIAGAHVDSPRIDLKQNPLYESDELAYFKTHYYGGIKKYQWVTIPLELHGVVALKNGETIDVSIGHDPSDPQFVITDLLPHLGKEQMRKTMEEGITGEGLNILIGSIPYADEGSDRVKLAVMSILNDRYGIVEEDFLSAELTAVPAFEVREIGLDRSLIGGYGHDDRVCAYAELKAILDLDEAPERRQSASSRIRKRQARTASAACRAAHSSASWKSCAPVRTFLCAAALKTASACRRMSPRRLIRTSPRSAKSATMQSSTTAWASASSPALEARAERATLRPRSSATCAEYSPMQALSGR